MTLYIPLVATDSLQRDANVSLGVVHKITQYLSVWLLSSQCRHHRRLSTSRLFTVPYFSVKSQRSIVEFERSPSWFLYASEPTGILYSPQVFGF